ncbi:hypothetical protein [Streptomyces albus]|uniref:hypothetical protein n=1 Tax=Streptomyces sp. NRRL F-5639 TaxID=1463867 RepID=UPI0004CBEE45|nr:hypothetical protein [Streptomyces sp. NRRL F-5639]
MTDDGFEIRQRVGSWVLAAWWPTGHYQGGPQRLAIEPAPDADPRDKARGVTTTVLRRMEPELSRIAEKTQELHKSAYGVAQQLDQGADAVKAVLASEGISERYLALLSALYVGASEAGNPAPVRWLAESLGKNLNTIKDHMKRARRDGFLETTADRKAGGVVTEKARQLLEAD